LKRASLNDLRNHEIYENKKGSLMRFWSEWFGTMGREVGSPERRYVGTVHEFLAFIGTCELENRPCYCSVQPCKERDAFLYLLKLFFDFDSKEDPPDLDRAWAEASDFADKLRFFYGTEPLTVFSGRKGYHVYVWLRNLIYVDVKVGDRPQELVAKEVYRTLQNKLLWGLNYGTLDPQPIGDIKRLGRLPYTTHEGSGLLCQPVDEGRRPMELTSLEAYRANGLTDDFFSRVVKEVVEGMELKGRRASGPKVIHGDVREPVRALIEAAKGGQKLSHGKRLIVLFELINKGYGDEAIQETFSRQPDYDSKIVQYFIDHARKKGYLPYRTENIMREVGVQ